MSTTSPQDHLDLASSLAESKARKDQSEHDRFIAELSLPPISAAASDGTQPGSDTEGQRSQYQRYSYDREGSEQRSDHGVNSA